MQSGGNYAQVSAQGLYGGGADMVGQYGVTAPAGAQGQVIPFPQSQATNAAGIIVPKDFWRSSGFGLIVLIALVIYFDVRVLNR